MHAGSVTCLRLLHPKSPRIGSHAGPATRLWRMSGPRPARQGPVVPTFPVKRFCQRFLAAAVTGLAVRGAAPEQSIPAPAIGQHAAAMRTVVPLTHPVALDKAGTIADLEFEPPPSGLVVSSLLKVAIRLPADEGAALLAPSDQLVTVGLAARVTLHNLAAGSRHRYPFSASAPPWNRCSHRHGRT